ncbi:hypothetical protein HYU14_05650 [Candidatus Woesearchaeota archaeon]|nr:hypothetical protein [Candidatus Woesearchaeota archaeon]
MDALPTNGKAASLGDYFILALFDPSGSYGALRLLWKVPSDEQWDGLPRKIKQLMEIIEGNTPREYAIPDGGRLGYASFQAPNPSEARKILSRLECQFEGIELPYTVICLESWNLGENGGEGNLPDSVSELDEMILNRGRNNFLDNPSNEMIGVFPYRQTAIQIREKEAAEAKRAEPSIAKAQKIPH